MSGTRPDVSWEYPDPAGDDAQFGETAFHGAWDEDARDYLGEEEWEGGRPVLRPP